MTNILIAGYYGLNNIGDEAILSGMITSLKKYIEDPHFYVVTNNPEETLNIHNINPIQQSFKQGIPKFLLNCATKAELFNILKYIDKCDVFILGGGSLLQDLKFYYLPLLLSLLSYAKNKNKITVVYGIGAGPIDTQAGKYLCKKVLNRMDLITVRDPMSKDVLEKCKVMNVFQTADPAFGLERSFFLSKKKSMPANELYLKENYLGVTLNNWLHDTDKYNNLSAPTNDLNERRKSIANIFSRISQIYNKDILFIPTVKIDEVGYRIIQKYAKCANTSRDYSSIYYTNDFNYICSIISKSNLIIGMRLHSLILASIMGIPFVPISYCGKTKSYLELIGLDSLYLDIEDLDKVRFGDNLISNIGDVFENKNHYSSLLLREANKLRIRAIENAKMVSELIK